MADKQFQNQPVPFPIWGLMPTRDGAPQRWVSRLERQLILQLVGDVDGCRVLDVGCGDGKFAVELAKRGAIVVGIDASSEI